jgi:hypothetical protein
VNFLAGIGKRVVMMLADAHAIAAFASSSLRRVNTGAGSGASLVGR